MKNAFLIFCIAATSFVSQAAEVSLGSWRDRAGTAFDRTIEILEVDGVMIERSRFRDGSQKEFTLLEIKKKKGEQHRFVVVGNSFGKGRAILRDGDLNLFDSDGFIRKAILIDPK